jgi:transaldolase / glucose-6-phosphate isomerase
MMSQCNAGVSGARNPGLVLGAILGQFTLDGRDKLTILADKSVSPFGAWLEQLIAESSGKQGKGILPVVGEQMAGIPSNLSKDSESYGIDRLFVYLRREGELDGTAKSIQESGNPVLVFNVTDAYDLGSEFYRWEVATAIACSILGVNAFDQPDVQDAKDRTMTKIKAYDQSKHLDQGTPFWDKNGTQAFSTLPISETSLVGIFQAFLNVARKGNYVAINAYLPRNPDMVAALMEIRLAIRAKTGCATTIGFGPRFLHSAGQLHKGGPDTGLFLQITADPVKDLDIPGQGMSFGTLERAQALGDYEALAGRGRRILRLNLPSPGSIKSLVDALKDRQITSR